MYYFKIREKGLIIITGCCHAGIINTIKYAQSISKCKKIYAIIGGFHLSGEYFEQIIPKTITELKKFDVKYIVPSHCTGWLAINKIANEMGKAFIPASVGSILTFK